MRASRSVGDVDQGLGRRFLATSFDLALDARSAATGCFASAITFCAELLDRLLVFGDLAAPDPRRRVAEDDHDPVAEALRQLAAPRSSAALPQSDPS